VFDELFYSIIFTNPCNSAAAWPGGMPPPPPVIAPDDNPQVEELTRRMNRSEYSLFRQALDNGTVGDRLSWMLLRQSGFCPRKSSLVYHRASLTPFQSSSLPWIISDRTDKPPQETLPEERVAAATLLFMGLTSPLQSAVPSPAKS
jgi:hypothetical protein